MNPSAHDENGRAARLLLERAPWDAIDTGYEKKIPFDDPSEHEDLLSRLVREGRAALHHLTLDGQRVGLLITRVEVGAAGRELVVIATCYRGPGVAPLSPLVSRAVDALAQAERCCTIRFHTVRPALARFACHELDYHITEIVLRKNVS